jgi:hypothetical protein
MRIFIGREVRVILLLRLRDFVGRSSSNDAFTSVPLRFFLGLGTFI